MEFEQKQTEVAEFRSKTLRSLYFLLLMLLPLAGFADAPDWENEQILHINTEPPRATFVPFATVAQALEGNFTNSPFYLSLDGEWKFNWVPKPELRPTNFFATDFDDSAWKTLAVPANWEMNGYGTPIYVSSGYPFKIDPPRVTSEPPTNYTAFMERDPVGSYRRTLELPANWDGRQVFIHFDGVESAFYVWVNGQLAGYSQNSRSPAEFEITPLLHSGSNQIAFQVFKYSDGSYLEDQDMWRMGGIIRSVYLYSTATARIRDFAVRTTFDAGYANAMLEIKPVLAAAHDLTLTNWTVQAQLFDAQGKPVLLNPIPSPQPSVAKKTATAIKADKPSEPARPAKQKKNKTPVAAFVFTNQADVILNRDWSAKIMNDRTPQRGEPKFAWISALIRDPAKWTAETPNLYTLVLSLCDANGNVVEADRCAVGFRQIEIRNGQFLINGQPIKLRGVNRHEINPDTGHTITEADMIKDLVLMKQANLNAVRTCHYPDSPRWYELCDRYGLYVLDEANLEAQGTRGALASDPRWAAAFLDRAISLAERDKNHPSVIMWSLGNESGYGPNFAAMSAWLHQFDPTRPVHYEGAQGAAQRDLTFEPGETKTPAGAQSAPVISPDPAGVDVVSRFYPRVVQAYAKPNAPENTRWDYLLKIAQQTNDTRPVLTSEYAHAMGNAIGNLQEYWDEFYSNPRMLGGFIWEWVDQGLRLTTTNGTQVIAYGGDFGDAPNLGIFCIKGIVTSDRELYPKYWEVKHVHQPVTISAEQLKLSKVTLKVVNRNSFLDLTNYTMHWALTSSRRGEIQAANLPSVHCAPGMETIVKLSLPVIPDLAADEDVWLRVSFQTREDSLWAKAGHEIAWQQFTLPSGRSRGRSPHQAKTGAVDLTDTGDVVTISGANFSVTFNRIAGTMTSLNYGGHEVLGTNKLSGPVLQLFRAPTDNDRGFGKWLAKDWHYAGLSNLVRQVESFEVTRKKPDEIQIVISVLSIGTNTLPTNGVALTNTTGIGTNNPGGTNATDLAIIPVTTNTMTGTNAASLEVDDEAALETNIEMNVVRTNIFQLKTTWTIHGDGSVDMDSHFKCVECFSNLVVLPRVGVVLQLARDYENIRWLGRGPLESYPDRKNSIDLGTWSSTVNAQYFPYIRPQETGNHEDTRWVELTDSNGSGLKVSAAENPFSFSTLHFTANDLASVRHYHELQSRPEIILSLDAQMCGLGNSSCGPGVLERYAVPPGKYQLSLRFAPVTNAHARKN